MHERTSSTLRRWRLAHAMHQLRKEAGKNVVEAAEEVGIAKATLYRIEQATHAPSPPNILALCHLYGVGETDTEFLVGLARDSRKRGWWQPHATKIPDWFRFFLGVEEEATRIADYHGEVVPGLFQTEAYARATFAAEAHPPAPEDIDALVSVRLGRLPRLLAGAEPAHILSVVGEGVLHRLVGGPRVMAEQLRRLLEVSHLPTVTVQVLPHSAGAHPAMQGPFTILDLPGFGEAVYLEHRTRSDLLKDPEEVSDYTLAMERLLEAALGPEDSRALIQHHADTLDPHEELS